jgi:hypothetical protein
MIYDNAPLVLHGHDRNRMLNFLSDVFEFEVIEEECLAQNFGLFLKIEQNKSIDHSSNNQPSVEFTFKLTSENEIDELINKFNFFMYRRKESLENSMLENFEIIEDANIKKLIIKDTDQRPWSFIFYKGSV